MSSRTIIDYHAPFDRGLTFELSVIIQMKANEQYYPVTLFVMLHETVCLFLGIQPEET